MLICRLHVDIHVHFLKLCLKTVSLDYIPEPTKKPPAAGTSTLEVMADVHQRFDDVNSGEVEVLERTQEGNQVTQF